MKKSIFHQSGYFFNDDRASGGALVEDDLIGCKHCHAPIKKSVWRADGGYCTACDGPICTHCFSRVRTHGCENHIRTLETAVELAYRRMQNSKILGA